MITGFLYILLVAGLGAALCAVFQRVAQRRLDVLPFCALFSLFQFIGALAGMNWNGVRESGAHPVLALAGIMAACGLCNGLGIMAQIEAMKRGHAGISNALVQTALLIPFTASILIWKEHASPLNLVGIAGILLMSFLLGQGGTIPGQNTGRFSRWLFFILLAWVGYGFAQFTYLIPSRWMGNPALLGGRPLFMMLSQSLFFILIAVGKHRSMSRAMVPSALLGAVVGLGYLYAVALAADALSPVNLTGIIYPLAVGGAIILFALYSRIALREPYPVRSWIGLIAGVIGIILICIR